MTHGDGHSEQNGEGGGVGHSGAVVGRVFSCRCVPKPLPDQTHSPVCAYANRPDKEGRVPLPPEDHDARCECPACMVGWGDAPGRTHSPACRVDGHGRRCIADRYETVLLHESGPGEWTLNLHPNGLEWSVLVDLADAIKQAQTEGVSE